MTTDELANVCALHLVNLDVVVLHYTPIAIGLGENEELGDVSESRSKFQSKNFWKLIKCLVPDNGLDVVNVQRGMLHIIDHIQEVFDGRARSLEPGLQRIFFVTDF